ncbi:hypothetical protein ACFFWC_05740 [Plantactinospora siamensis]|uniref:Uncharacterized protein n=1 Tax=Plantactinospora siamensis TaxID=555372 RepID=A0ABV6NYH7_9ACTN
MPEKVITSKVGLDDLLDGCGGQLDQGQPGDSRQRLARHRPTERWPGVRVVT